MVVNIRRAITSDLVNLQNLFVASIHEICSADYSAEQVRVWTSSVKNDARWRRIVDDQFCLIAEIDDRVGGFGSLDGDYIDFLYVHPTHLRKGLATMLFSGMEEEARRNGMTNLFSDVSKTARPFFERMGFMTTRENQKIVDGVEIRNFRMVKLLGY